MKPRIMLAATLLWCTLAGCGSSPEDSLIGAWKIPSDTELAQERVTLFFRKENGTYYPATLSYSLAPNGLLTIEKGRDHAVCCFGGIDRHLTDARWQVTLPADDQNRIRRNLARLRPKSLSKDVPFALPRGCDFTSDTRSWSGVGFYRGKVGALFIFQRECQGAGAEEAKRLLASVVAALPTVDGSAEFLKAR